MNRPPGPEVTSSESEGRQEPPSADSDVLGEIFKQFSELFEYASHYASTSVDGAKRSARRAAIRVLVEIGFTLAAAGAVVIALTLLFIGIAGGLGEWLGHGPWLGNLVAGLLLLTLIGAAVWLRIAQVKKSSLERTMQSYERRKLRQRTRFGRDVTEQAAAARAKN